MAEWSQYVHASTIICLVDEERQVSFRHDPFLEVCFVVIFEGHDILGIGTIVLPLVFDCAQVF